MDVIVLLSLLHYVSAVLIAISIVSVALSNEISYDLDECNKNADVADCFFFNYTVNDSLYVKAINDCALSETDKKEIGM